MLPLFKLEAELSALPFLARHAADVGIIAPLAELDTLPHQVHTPGTAALTGKLRDVEVVALDAETQSVLARRSREKLWVVANPDCEDEALNALRRHCPDHFLLGLTEALFPALVARKPGAVFNRLPRKAPCQQMTLILAPPRSGSSFVADVVGQIIGSKTREHLRKEVIEVFGSSYNFDRSAALRNFIYLVTTQDGQAATKIISHFLQDYIAKVGDLGTVRRVFEGVSIRPIIIEREDKVAQAISVYLAERRGIWHLESGGDAERLEAVREVGYDFRKLLALYLRSRQQSYVIDFMREIFPDHLALEYGGDIEAGDAAALGARISAFLGLPWMPGAKRTGRAKLANEENALLYTRFREEYRTIFGREP